MGKLKTKPRVTIIKLIDLSIKGDIIWEFDTDRNSEYLYCKYEITKDKVIDIRLTNYNNGYNYFIEFYYKHVRIADYYYQSFNEIFKLFICAKFVNFIKTTGKEDFIKVLISQIDIFNWKNINDYYYSTMIGKSNDEKATINVWDGGIEVELNSDILIYIRDKTLFKLMIKNKI